MGNKKIKNKMLFAGVAATAVYWVAAGKGPFNKYRFKTQHEELAKYVDTNYPDCTYSPISAHGKGWCATVLRMGRPVTFVYFSKGDDGMYVFTELNEKMK